MFLSASRQMNGMKTKANPTSNTGLILQIPNLKKYALLTISLTEQKVRKCMLDEEWILITKSAKTSPQKTLDAM